MAVTRKAPAFQRTIWGWWWLPAALVACGSTATSTPPAGSFQLSAPSSLMLTQGSSALYEVQVTGRDHFSSPASSFSSVTLSGPARQAGVTLTYRKDLSSMNALAFTLSSPSNVPTGTYDFTLTASASGVQASTTTHLTVTKCSFGCL